MPRDCSGMLAPVHWRRMSVFRILSELAMQMVQSRFGLSIQHLINSTNPFALTTVFDRSIVSNGNLWWAMKCNVASDTWSVSAFSKKSSLSVSNTIYGWLREEASNAKFEGSEHKSVSKRPRSKNSAQNVTWYRPRFPSLQTRSDCKWSVVAINSSSDIT